MGLPALVVMAVIVIAVITRACWWRALVIVLLGVPMLCAGAAWASYAKYRNTTSSPDARAAVDRGKNLHERIELASHKGDENHHATDVAKAESPVERPTWVDAPPGMTGKAYRCTIVVGPYSTVEECEKELSTAMRRSAAQYVERVGGTEASSHVTVTDGDLRHYVLRDVWQETVHSSVGPMVQLHALLEFDDAMRKQIEQTWRTARVRTRLSYLGAAIVGVLVCLSGAHLWLRPARLPSSVK